MKTFITGATGFIGGRLTTALLERGDSVRALVLESEPAEPLLERGVEVVRGDMTDPASLRAAVAGAELVYHCAALVGDWIKREEIQRVNVEGTRSLLGVCAEAGVRRVMYVSSIATLGKGSDESAPYQYTGDAYTDAKIDSEKVVRGFIERGDVGTVILRPAFVYGPGDRQFLPGLLRALAEGKFAYVGDGSKVLNMMYVDELAEAALLADSADVAQGQIYNLTDGTRTSLREFVTFICEHVGIPPPTRQIPPRVAWAALYVSEVLTKVRRPQKPPRLNRGRMKFLTHNQHYSIEKARRELGYEPQVTYREGLPPTLDWFRESSLLPDEIRQHAHVG